MTIQLTQPRLGQSTRADQPGQVEIRTQQPKTAAEVREQIQAMTGISSLTGGDGMSAAEATPFDAIVQMGLNHTALTDVEQSFINGLGAGELAGLKSVANAIHAGMGVSAGANLADGVQAQWADTVGTIAGGGREADVNALVQWVLRESYLETSKDLYFYAEKVKFFNSAKKAIRDELQRARDAMVAYAGSDPETPLQPPFVTNPPNTEFTGSTSVTVDPAAKQAQAALAAAQNQLNESSSGSGVVMLDAAAKAQLKPPAFGDVFVTLDANGKPLYRIDYKGSEVRIYGPPGPDGQSQLVSRIWGDPHVDESSTGSGDDWHFGSDSTFILPDGTKVSLNTQETSPGVFYTKGIDIQSGSQHAFAGVGLDGQGREAGVSNDRARFDAQWTDAQGTASGVFALQANGQWAVMGSDGAFYDVKSMDWGTYLREKRVDTQGSPVTVSAQVELAARDHLGSMVNNFDQAMAEAALHGDVLTTKAGLENYIKDMEEKLSSVGDDAQLANVDLQNMLQKQQQGMQMMSNISKMLHDTALAIVRKMG